MLGPRRKAEQHCFGWHAVVLLPVLYLLACADTPSLRVRIASDRSLASCMVCLNWYALRVRMLDHLTIESLSLGSLRKSEQIPGRL